MSKLLTALHLGVRSLAPRAWHRVPILLLAAVLMLHGPGAAGLELPLVWQTELRAFVTGPPMLVDLDGDGALDIVVPAVAGLIALDGQGQELWRFTDVAAGRAYPTIGYPGALERPGQSALVYAAGATGDLFCVDGHGQEVWRSSMGGHLSWTGAVLCDLGSDGRFEVVHANEEAVVCAFDAESGKPLWRAPVAGSVEACLAAADLDGDGSPEIVVPCMSGHIEALNGDGSKRWSTKVAQQVYSAPVVFTDSRGDTRIVAGSGDARLICLDARGELLWERQADSSIDSSVSVGDINQDGRPDIFFVTQGGQIWRLDEDGGLVWELAMGARTDAAGAIADVTGDGQPEYVLCTHTARLLILEGSGKVLLDEKLSSGAYNATPAIGDVVPGGGRELVITAGGTAGVVLCLSSPSGPQSPVEWASFRAGPSMTGACVRLAARNPVSVTPPDLSPTSLVAGKRTFTFLCSNRSPDPARPLQATVECEHPGGARTLATAKLEGTDTLLNLPVEMLSPGSYRFSWWVEDPEGTRLVAGQRAVDAQPFASSALAVEEAVNHLQEAADAVSVVLPLSARALHDKLSSLKDSLERISALARRLPGMAPADREQAAKETGDLVASARRLEKIAGLIGQAAVLGPDTSLLLFEAPLWENLEVDKRLPSEAHTQLALRRPMVPDEYEPVAIGMLNITDRPLQVRVLPEVSDQGPQLELLHPVAVPSGDGRTAWDALAQLESSNVISVAPLAVEQIWCNVRSGELQPGQYSVGVRFLALNGAGVHETSPYYYQAVPPPVSEAEVTVEILDFRAAPRAAFRHCNWATVTGTVMEGDLGVLYEDLLAHGTNVFLPRATPQASFDGEGNLVGDVDFSAFDAEVRPLAGHDVVFLMQSLGRLTPQSGEAEPRSNAYRRALAQYLPLLSEHMREMGWTRENFAYYPTDEPGLGGWESINQFIELAKIVREADPQVQIYADCVADDPAMWEAMDPYVDIWCPPTPRMGTLYLQHKEIMHRSGKPVWAYGHVGDGLVADLVDCFRADALYSAAYGLTGSGFYAFYLGDPDPWQRRPHEYSLVYPGRQRVVGSRRWEAVREGIEDARILMALRSLTRAAEAKGVAEDVCAQVHRMLDVELVALTQRGFDLSAVVSLRNRALNAGVSLTQALRDVE